MIPLEYYILLAAILFAISLTGIFLHRKNVLFLLMYIEIMLLAVNTNFIAFAANASDLLGEVFVFFILTVAAAETSVGLAIVVLVFRQQKSINISEINQLKG